MPHYLKFQTVDKLGFRSTLAYTTNGTISLRDGETIDANNTASTASTTFNITNYSSDVVLYIVVINRNGTGSIYLKPTSSNQINDNGLGNSIDLRAYS